MAWINIAKIGNIWAYENGAKAAHTYPDAPGTYSGGIRSFNPPGPAPVQEIYVRCRMVADSVERGELSKTFYDAQ